jgi:hypothetical protein
MKKLLSVALCAVASMAMAATEVTIANVGVTVVSIPANQTNTIIAASFNDLADISNPAVISNLVKTTNLTAGDELRLYKDGKYSVWTFDGDKKAWIAPTSVTSTGSKAGADPATTGATAGSGLWFIRKSTAAMDLVLYGTTLSTAKTSTLAAGWNLIGNSSFASYEIKDGTKGDIIRKVVNGEIREYTKKTAGWKYQKIDSSGNFSWVTENPTVAAGEGIWYNAKSAGSITWEAAAEQ